MGKLIQLSDFLCAAENNSRYSESLRRTAYGPYASHTLRLTKTVSGKILPEPALFFIEKHRSTGLIRISFNEEQKNKISKLFMRELLQRTNPGKESDLEKIIYRQYYQIAQKNPDSLVLFETALFRLADMSLSPALISLKTKEAIDKGYYASVRWRNIIRTIRKSIRKRGIHPIFIADVSVLPIIGPLWEYIPLDLISNLINELGLPLGIFVAIYKIVTRYAVKKSIDSYITDRTRLKKEDLNLIDEKLDRFRGEIPIETQKKLKKIFKKNKLKPREDFLSSRGKEHTLLIDVLESFENIYELFTIPPGELLSEISDELTYYYKILNKSGKRSKYREEEIISLKNLQLGGKKYIADAKGALDAMRAVLVGVFEPIRSAKALLDIVRIWPDEELTYNSNDSSDLTHHAAIVLIENDNFYRFGDKSNIIIRTKHDKHLYKQINSLINEYFVLLTLIFGDIDSTSQEEIEGLQETIRNITSTVEAQGLKLISFGPMTLLVVSDRGPEAAKKIGLVIEKLIPEDNSPIPGISMTAAPEGPGFMTKVIDGKIRVTSGETTKRALTLAKLSWSVGRCLCDLPSTLALISGAQKYKILSMKQTVFPELNIDDTLAHILVRRDEPHNILLKEPDLFIQFFGVMNKSKQVMGSDDYIGDLSTAAGISIDGPIFTLNMKK